MVFPAESDLAWFSVPSIVRPLLPLFYMATRRKESSTNQLNQLVLRAACPVNDTLARLSPRWKMQVLFCIHHGQNQFSSLKSAFSTLSDQVLSQRLRELVQEDLVRRQTDETTVPPQVRYFTTPKGAELLTIMAALHRWEQQFAVEAVVTQ